MGVEDAATRITQIMGALSAEDREIAQAVLSNITVREYMRKGAPVVRLTHTPSGTVVEEVRGVNSHEAYQEAFDEMIAHIVGSKK